MWMGKYKKEKRWMKYKANERGMRDNEGLKSEVFRFPYRKNQAILHNKQKWYIWYNLLGLQFCLSLKFICRCGWIKLLSDPQCVGFEYKSSCFSMKTFRQFQCANWKDFVSVVTSAPHCGLYCFTYTVLLQGNVNSVLQWWQLIKTDCKIIS